MKIFNQFMWDSVQSFNISEHTEQQQSPIANMLYLLTHNSKAGQGVMMPWGQLQHGSMGADILTTDFLHD